MSEFKCKGTDCTQFKLVSIEAAHSRRAVSDLIQEVRDCTDNLHSANVEFKGLYTSMKDIQDRLAEGNVKFKEVDARLRKVENVSTTALERATTARRQTWFVTGLALGAIVAYIRQVLFNRVGP